MSQEERSEALIEVLEELDHRFESLFGQSSASSDDIDVLVEFLEAQR